MNALRLTPLPLHAALRMATGLVTMAAPLLVGFDVAATLTAIIVGSLVVGLALAAVPDERGRSAVPAGLLQVADWAAVLAVAGTALGVAPGDPKAAVTLAGIALVQLAGNLTTRYEPTGYEPTRYEPAHRQPDPNFPHRSI